MSLCNSGAGYGSSPAGVANLGCRPKAEGRKVNKLPEVYLFRLEYEIYGEKLEIEFVFILRAQQIFEGAEGLKG